jgi:hypothetical protein
VSVRSLICGSSFSLLNPNLSRRAGETGEGRSVQVRHDEGIAIRIDPEPCAVVRKGDSEASVGGRIGQPSSLVKIRILGADAIAKAEGNMDGRIARASGRPGVAEEPGMCGSSLGGNREIPRLANRG